MKKIPLILILILPIPLFLVLYFLTVRYFFPCMENQGQFGDMFGGANALFSGLAFAGIIYTIHLQRSELSLQRQELELTRGELKRSAAAQEKSEKALVKQSESLKTTAKLNGLNSLLEYEIAKTNQDNTLRGESNRNSFTSYTISLEGQEEIDKIIRDIRATIANK